MFSSLKIKLKSFLEPIHRRSVSICVESKAKKIESKRDQSEKKRNTLPQEVEFTPRKFTSIETRRSCFDQMDTNKKQVCVPVRTETALVSNTNQNWLDFVSDIDSGRDSNKLLPSSQDLRPVEQIKANSKKISKEKKDNAKTPKKTHSNHIQTNKSENTLINWLQENKPDYFMIKLCKDSEKKTLASDIKKKRLQEYEQQKRKTAKGKSKMQCIICEEEAFIKESFQLACTHRIHKICADLIKWKPKMRCNICEGKSVKDLVISTSKIVQGRRSSISAGKKFKNLRSL